MAGHRKARGAPRRDTARAQRMRGRYEAETDPARRLDAAFDWLRSELAHLARARVPDGAVESRQLTVSIAAQLIEWAQQASERGNAQ
jgi:hypothetical protein